VKTDKAFDTVKKLIKLIIKLFIKLKLVWKKGPIPAWAFD